MFKISPTLLWLCHLLPDDANDSSAACYVSLKHDFLNEVDYIFKHNRGDYELL